jgi:hypothetical protein
MESDDKKLVTVFSTANKGAFLIAKSVLEGSGIQYFTKHEYLEVIAYGADTQDILVNEKDAETVRNLLKNIKEKDPLYNFEEKQQKKLFVHFGIYASIVTALIIILLTVFAVSC